MYERIQHGKINGQSRELKSKFELSFANNQSIWEAIREISEGGNGIGAGAAEIAFQFSGSTTPVDDLVYYNYATGKRLEKRELNQKNYIVEDSVQKINWKLTGENKIILGHKVQKAKAEKLGTRSYIAIENGVMKRQEVPDTAAIIAWFAPDIPVPGGPEYGGQLPGMILELNVNNGRTVYRAVEISPKVNAGVIKEPKGNKRISAADYNTEQVKVVEQVRRNRAAGASGPTIVIPSADIN